MRIPDGLPSFPYPGMRPFEPSDSTIFFGQDENIEALIENLGRARFVAVLGESGVGKSSLVKAGLIPELRRGNTSLWHIPVFKPGISPLAELASALREVGLAGDAAISDIISRLRTHRASLREMINDALLPPDERVLIVVDQFEELFRFRWPDDPRFSVHTSPEHSLREDAALFVKLLLTAATSSVPPVYVLVTMRAEFLGDCAAFYELGEAMNQGAFLLPRMKRDQYTSAINEPLRLYGYDIERSLLHELLNETMTAPEDALPLLQHALRWLWDRHARDPDRILSMNDFMPTDATMKKYSKTVPIQVILDAHLDEVYDELKRAGLEKPTERLMRCLGEYDQKGRLIRRSIHWDTARAVAFAEDAKCTAEVLRQNSDQLKRIIDTFRDANRGRSFLVCMPGPNSQLSSDESGMIHCARLELSHEVILRQWSKLGQWFHDEKKNAEQYHYLAEQANRYPHHATLLSGPALQMAERWLAEFSPTAGWAERYSQYDASTRVFRYDLGRTVDFVRKSIRVRRNKYSTGAAHAKSPHPVEALLRSLVRRVFSPRFLIPCVIVCAVVLFAEDRLESLFESNEDSFVARAYFRLTDLYQKLVTWQRFPYPRYTAIVAIDKEKEPHGPGLNDQVLPLERKAVAELICRVHTASPAVIAVDKTFSPDFSGTETDDLRRAIDSVTRDTVLIIGRKFAKKKDPTDPRYENVLMPTVDFRIPNENEHFQEAIVNIDPDTRKIPLGWEVYESREEAEKSTRAPKWRDTFSLQAAHARPGELLQRNRRISSLIHDHENPYTSFLKADEFKPILAGQILEGWIRVPPEPPDDVVRKAVGDAKTCSSGPLPKVLSEQMAGRVVLIGEIDHDIDDHSTVVGQMSGLLLQANYVEALLDDRVFPPVRALDFLFGLLILVTLEASLIVFRSMLMEAVESKPASTLFKAILSNPTGILKAALSALVLLGIGILVIGFILIFIVQLGGYYVEPTPLGIIPVATEILGFLWILVEVYLRRSSVSAGHARPDQGTSNS
jgi:CHASE2 domain-containing sensor protein